MCKFIQKILLKNVHLSMTINGNRIPDPSYGATETLYALPPAENADIRTKKSLQTLLTNANKMKRSCNSGKKNPLASIIYGFLCLLLTESCSEDKHDVYCFKNGGCFTVIDSDSDLYEYIIVPGAYPEGPYPDDNYLLLQSGTTTILGNIYHDKSRLDTMTMLVVNGGGILRGDFAKFGIRVEVDLSVEATENLEKEMKEFVRRHVNDTIESFCIVLSGLDRIQQVSHDSAVIHEGDDTLIYQTGRPFHLH
jgi:hypothetical protein